MYAKVTLVSQLLISILIIASCELPSNEETASISGTVKNVGTNTPISGVIVRCDDKTSTTGQDGVYQISNIVLGEYQLTASKSDYELYSNTVTISSSGTNHNIYLTSNISGASVWGYIRHVTGTAIAGAVVEIANMSDHTDATGRYQLPSVPQGNQIISVSASGYESFQQSFYMYSSDKELNLNLRQYFSQNISINKDTYLVSAYDNNFGNEVYLASSNAQNNFKAIYILAPLGIPDNAQITSVKFKAYIYSSWVHSGGWDFRAHPIYENWEEHTITWTNKPNYGPSMSALCSYYSGLSNGDEYQLDLTTLFTQHYSLVNQYGFILYPEFNSDAVDWGGLWFYSSDHASTSYRPLLIVEYLY